MNSPAQRVKLSARQAYELWAPFYDTNPNAVLALEERCFPASMAEFCRKDVVELGCGTGRLLRRLERVAPWSLTGVDASRSMLAQAKRKCMPSTRLILADCLTSSLPDQSADCVLSSFVLSHLSDIRQFAREAARIARPGGVIIISDLHPNSVSYGWSQSFCASNSRIEIETHSYTLPELVNAMQDAGCALQELTEPCFGAEDEAIFRQTGKMEELLKVTALPVIYRAKFTVVTNRSSLSMS